MTHTLVAELVAQADGAVNVVRDSVVIASFPNLPLAEEYCFSLGADTVASMKGMKGVLRATKAVKTYSRVNGAARIGHGTKLHPAFKDTLTGFVQCICGCPGTSNNHARVSGFWVDQQANCRKR
jgi:hypothetical protein